MIKKNLFSKAFLTIITLIVSLVTANLSIADDEVKTELITLSIKTKIGPFYYLDKKEVKKLSISRHGISSPVTYQGSKNLLLFFNKPSPEDIEKLKRNQEPFLKPDLVVELDQSAGRMLLLFSQGEAKGNEPPSIRVRSHPLSNKASSKGSYLIFNLSRGDVFISLDKKGHQIKPMKSVTIKTTSVKKTVVDLEIKLGQEQDGKLKAVYNSVWGHQPSQRAILFVYDRPSGKGGLAVRRYYDHPGSNDDSE